MYLSRMNCRFLILTLLIYSSSLVAPSTQPCPLISVDAVDKVDNGAPLVFTARVNISEVSAESLKYRWWISIGTITAGKTSPSITVDTVGLGGQVITATVEAAGAESSCAKSKTVVVNPLPPPMDPFDSYGDIRFSSEKARLDNFAIQIQNYPGSRGAMFTYAGKETYKGEALDRLRRAKNYLVKVRGLKPERILTIDAGYATDVTTYLVVVPPGANVPIFESRLPVTEVRFTKRKRR
jgi:hypothetical protein